MDIFSRIKNRLLSDDSRRDEHEETQTEAGEPPLGDDTSRLLGKKLKGRYVLEEEIGHGGVGVVLRAVDLDVHRRSVVVKMLLDHALGNQWLVAKFMHESEALARIDDPGVVKILDRGRTPSGRPFFVMEYVRGETLRSRISDGPLALAAVARIARQIGQALSAAHEQGVYHRDLKPGNVLLQPVAGGREYAKLIDFGIAKLEDPMSAAATVAPIAAGTVLYMAPEQLEGEEGSPASDVYSFGVVCYEMITGQLPFRPTRQGRVAALHELLQKQSEGRYTRPSELRPEVSPEVERLLASALAFEPEARPANAHAFADELARALGAEVGPAPQRETAGLASSAPGASREYATLRRVDRGDVTVLRFTGWNEAVTPEETEAMIREALQAGRTRLVVNCEDLAYISSSGIGALLGQIATVREHGGDIKICCTGPRVDRILQLVGMHVVFDMTRTEDEAVAKFASPT